MGTSGLPANEEQDAVLNYIYFVPCSMGKFDDTLKSVFHHVFCAKPYPFSVRRDTFQSFIPIEADAKHSSQDVEAQMSDSN